MRDAALLEGAPAQLVACALSARRLDRIRTGFGRLGLPHPHVVAMDRASALADGARFDGVLVDAPCSNTGVLAQRPSARWRHGPSSQA